MWRETTKHRRNLEIFREELDSFLPPEILDFHVHVFDAATLPETERYVCAGHVLGGYGFEDLRRDMEEVYPGRKVSAVCFGLPDASYDMERNNRYVAGGADGKRFFPFRLVDPGETDAERLRDDITDNGFMGLKPYLCYVKKKDPEHMEVHDLLPPPIMDVANELGLIIMLHLPRSGRLADPVNQKQVVELCETYPKARIVLAHVGRAYFLKNVVGHLDKFGALSNLYFDLAMLNNWEVLEYLFRNVPAEKVLYGTDAPIALAPGKSVEINDQYTYITPVPWNLSISGPDAKIVFTSFLYEELRAIKKAMERVGLSDDFKRDLFYGNGMRLLGERR